MHYRIPFSRICRTRWRIWIGLAVLVFVLRHYKWLKMRIQQHSVDSYPTPRRTVTVDILPRSEDFSGSFVVWPAVHTAVDTDRSQSRRSFGTFKLIFVKCPCNAVSMKRHYNLIICNKWNDWPIYGAYKIKNDYRLIKYNMLITLLINSHKLRNGLHYFSF